MTSYMEVISFLRTNSLQALQDQYKVHGTRHTKYPNLVLLKYDQIESPMGERIVQECRGLILDESADWKVISRPYDKFFNIEEGHAAKIDWSSAVCYEKLDGSLMTMYWYDGKWQVASSGSSDASGHVHNNESKTFAELFWETWRQLGYELSGRGTTDVDEDVCFMFELMTPENRVIVPHQESRIVLHGVRDRTTGQEYAPDKIDAEPLGWEIVRSFPIRTFDEVMKAAAALNPMQQEGFVVVDKDFHRVKVKSPQYVALAHMKDGFSDRRMMEIIRSNESNEFLSYFPEYKPLYDQIKAKYDELVKYLEACYESMKGVESQKDFALNAKATKCSGALFALRAGKVKSVQEYLAGITINNFERLIS